VQSGGRRCAQPHPPERVTAHSRYFTCSVAQMMSKMCSEPWTTAIRAAVIALRRASCCRLHSNKERGTARPGSVLSPAAQGQLLRNLQRGAARPDPLQQPRAAGGAVGPGARLSRAGAGQGGCAHPAGHVQGTNAHVQLHACTHCMHGTFGLTLHAGRLQAPCT
jgi:hypothetical protein